VSAARDSLHGVEYLWNALRLYSLAGAQKDLLRLAYVDAVNAHERLEERSKVCHAPTMPGNRATGCRR
jgi:hypothetical protein